jgi:hypothetical protein
MNSNLWIAGQQLHPVPKPVTLGPIPKRHETRGIGLLGQPRSCCLFPCRQVDGALPTKDDRGQQKHLMETPYAPSTIISYIDTVKTQACSPRSRPLCQEFTRGIVAKTDVKVYMYNATQSG